MVAKAAEQDITNQKTKPTIAATWTVPDIISLFPGEILECFLSRGPHSTENCCIVLSGINKAGHPVGLLGGGNTLRVRFQFNDIDPIKKSVLELHFTGDLLPLVINALQWGVESTGRKSSIHTHLMMQISVAR